MASNDEQVGIHMAHVTIHLQYKTKQCLTEKAKQGGQTLETYLERVVEHHFQAGVGRNDTGLEANEDELAERPWRGVFVPPRPRNVLFSRDVSHKPEQVPKRQPALNMNWHREVTDDESKRPLSALFRRCKDAGWTLESGL